MSTKKLTASILLLVIGGLLIPSGFVTNDYLRSEVAKGVPDALLAIKDQVEPEIEETVKINGVPIVLLGIKEGALPEFEDNVEFEAILEILKTVKGEVILGINDMVNLEAIPEVLNGIKSGALPEIEKLLNLTAYLETLLGVKENIVSEMDESVKYKAIPTVLLGIKGEAVPEIEDMVKVQAIPTVLLGIQEEVVYQFYASVNASTAAQVINATITGVAVTVGLPLAKEEFFNNYTFQDDYSTTIEGVSERMTGGSKNLSYTPAAQDYLLYGNAGLPGLITDLEQGMGILEFLWYYQLAADGDMTINATMQAGYNATWSQLQMMAGYITGYLWEYVVPGVVYLMTNYWPNELAEVMFYEQWANCTVVPGGIDLGGGLKGLELNCTEPSNLSLTTSKALWNSTNPSSFVNDTGILIWAEAASPNVTIQIQLMTTFSLDPANLTIILAWLFTTIKDNVVPPLFEADRGISTTTFAEYLFYEQWANCTMNNMPVYPTGLDLGGGLTGLEVGCPNPSNISLTITIALWNSTNSSTFVNDSGIEKWLDAYTNTTIQAELISTFGLNATELGLVLNWLWVKSFKDNVVPPLFEADQGMSTTAYAEILFYEQWANCTVVPGGLDIGGGLKGFEVNCTVPTNISLTITRDLWDPTSSSSFINNTGLETWLAALTNDTIAEQLSLTIGLSTAQMTMMRGWLGNWISIVAPTLFYGQYQILLEDAPEYAFYEQWANGTIFNEEMFPGGVDFSLFFEEIQNSLIGFEIGLPPYPSNISFLAAKDLWDPTNSSSFTNFTIGFPKWKEAGISGDTAVLATLALTFGLNATTQMPLILNWLFTTVMNNFVPVLFALPDPYGKGMTTMAYARILFYDQWANGTLYSTGLDLGYGSALIGLLEVGVPTRSDISYMSAVELWDDTSIYAFVNDTGLQKWRDAATKLDDLFYLSMSLGLDILQMGLMLDWLDDIIDIFVPALFADPTLGKGMTIPAYAETLFYEQWANGTILGEKEYPQGLDLGEGLTGFEVGIPTASNISLAICELLWNELNVSTFVNDTGIGKWLDAVTNTTVQAELRTTFGLNATQMSLILNWLWENSFKDDVVPILAAEELGMSLSDYAEDLFFEQWANCTILGEKMFPEGIVLPIGDLTGVEVGCPTASNISLSVAEILFDDTNPSSIVDPSGLQKWYRAADSNSSEYSELKAKFDLTDTQMGMITTWLNNFRDEVVPVLAKEQMGLPADPYTLGSGLLLGMAIGGVCLAALGVVVLLLSRRT